jgi:hypothetical protein
MRERRCKANEPHLLVDRRRLDGCDLMPAEGLAHDVEAARERRVSEGLIPFARVGRADRSDERLLWIGQFGLRLGERGGD